MKAFLSAHVHSLHLVSAGKLKVLEKYEEFLKVHRTTFNNSEQKHVLIEDPKLNVRAVCASLGSQFLLQPIVNSCFSLYRTAIYYYLLKDLLCFTPKFVFHGVVPTGSNRDSTHLCCNVSLCLKTSVFLFLKKKSFFIMRSFSVSGESAFIVVFQLLSCSKGHC